jgi:hypothetical protein
MKNFNYTIGNRIRDLPACSAVPQPTVPTRAPLSGWEGDENVVCARPDPPQWPLTTISAQEDMIWRLVVVFLGICLADGGGGYWCVWWSCFGVTVGRNHVWIIVVASNTLCSDTIMKNVTTEIRTVYRAADKSLARPTSRYILFDGENISFDASLVTCINSTNIPPIMIINRIYEHQNLLSL